MKSAESHFTKYLYLTEKLLFVKVAVPRPKRCGSVFRRWLFEKLFGQKRTLQMTAILLGLILCYAFGTFWFLNISMNSGTSYGLMTALTMCVFPFIIPDICKLILAYFISKRVKHMLY